MRVVFIDVPPFATDEEADGTSVIRGRLIGAVRGRFRLPLFVRLRDGLVDAVTHAPDELLRSPDGAADPEGRLTAGGVGASPGQAADFPDYRGVRRDRFLAEVACGPLALLAVMRDLRVGATAADVDRILNAAGAYGTSMLQLKELAERQGLHALGVAVTAGRLRRMNHNAIVHLDGIGFAAVTGYPASGFRVEYPHRPPGVIPGDLFRRSFGKVGNALIVSRTPLNVASLGVSPGRPSGTPSDESSLQLSSSMLTAGRIHRLRWESSARITNVGSEMVTIKSVKESCPTCFSVKLGALTLAAGESTTITASGQEAQAGAFLHTVDLTSDEAGRPPLRIPVRGYIEPPVGIAPPALTLTAFEPDRPELAEVLLDLPPTVRPERLRVSVPQGAPLTAGVRRQPDGRVVLSIRWCGARPGWHRHILEIRDGEALDAVATQFHFAAHVAEPLAIEPPSVFVRGSELPQRWHRQITLRAGGKTAVRPVVSWENPPDGAGVVLSCVATSDRNWVVRLEPAGNYAPVSRRLLLKVATPGGEVRRIPVYLGEGSFKPT